MQIRNQKTKKNAGITLIALAITIIVLLILAGITIATILNNNSVIDRAKEAKEETQIATFKDKLNLAHAQAMTEKGIKGSITIEEYAEILKENEIISDTTIPGGNINEPYKDDDGNDVYEVNSDDGFTFDVIIEKNEEDNITTDNIRPTTEASKPRVRKVDITSVGTNSIAVKVTVSKLDDGKLSYYYKKTSEPDSSYKPLKENTTDLTANFTGLEQNVEYNIKVVATNSKGSHELVISSTTGELPSGTISQKGTTTWDPTNHTASIELETTTTGYTIQYQIGGTSGTWQDYTGPITGLNNGDKVYAVITDGANRSEPIIITIEDKTNPTVTITKGTPSTSTISVSVTSSDNESGMPTNPTYKYYIKKSTDADYPADATHTGTETTYTFTGLVQNTSYDVKVTTVDKANNSGEGTATEIKTKTVGGATGDLTTGNITKGTVTWNKDTHTASVTLSTSTDLTVQYKIGKDGTWTPATGTTATAGKDVTVSNLNHNDLVYARLIDDAGNYGDEAFMTILDGTAPTVTVSPETASITTSSIKVNITSKDDQSGMPTSPTYKYYIKKTADANYPADASYTGIEASYTFTGLVQNTSYDVKVTTVDKANNLGEGKAEKITTLKVGGATGDLTTGNITAGAATWNKETHKASVTLKTTTNLTIQYKIGESGTWTPTKGSTATAGKDVTVTNLNHNDLVYARLIDDAGNYGDDAFMTILDGQAPTVTVSPETANITTSSIKVNVTSKDDQGGMPASPTYKYYIKKTSDTNYPTDASYSGTEASYTFTGLVQNTSYDVKVTTVDKANNLGEGTATEIKTKTVGGATGDLTTGNITAGTVTWNKDTHKASVTLSTSTDLTVQYKIGKDGTWTPATGTTATAGKDVTVSNLNHNDILYARLIDTAGNYGDEAFITILDGTAPTVTVTKGTTTTSTVSVSVTSSDAEYGMPTSPTYKYYIKKSSDTNYPADASYSGIQASYTFTGLVQNTSYDVKVTTVDKANNLGEGKAEGIETKTVGGASSGLQTGNITAGAATWNKDTHTASVTLSTSTDLTIQYKIGSSGTWTPTKGSAETAGKDVTVTNLNHNDLVYARLIDDAGNYGDEAFITILDGIAPSEASITITPTSVNTGDTLKATVTHTDNESGVVTANSKYIWNTTAGKLGTTATEWNTATSFTNNPETITLDTKIDGTYYLHVLTVDNGGNKSEAISSAVTIKQLVTGITLNKTTETIKVGDTLKLTATVSPNNADNKKVNWSTSSSSIATVSTSGLVTAKAAGSVTITATAADGSGTSAKCKITVQSIVYVWEKWSVTSIQTYALNKGAVYLSERSKSRRTFWNPYNSYTFNTSTGLISGIGGDYPLANEDAVGKYDIETNGKKMTYVCSFERAYSSGGEGYSDYKLVDYNVTTSSTNYSKGTTKYSDVTSSSSSAYPTNGRSGDYWYVYKGIQ